MTNSINVRKLFPVRIEVVNGLALALMAFVIAGCDERATPASQPNSAWTHRRTS
jgi:hypothetical protein